MDLGESIPKNNSKTSFQKDLKKTRNNKNQLTEPTQISDIELTQFIDDFLKNTNKKNNKVTEVRETKAELFKR